VSGRRDLDEGLGHTPQSCGHLTPLRRSRVARSCIRFAARQAHPPIGSFDPGVRASGPLSRVHRNRRVAPGHGHIFIGGGLAAVSRTRAARHPERHAVFVGSGYRAGAFEVEAAYPPGSPQP
jgi:hypothetical protein